MIALQGTKVRLRAVEPEDVTILYEWENDPTIWRVSNTLAPCSIHTLRKFVEEQQLDIFQTGQQRLMIISKETEAVVGCVDLFEVDALNSRAGVGILIHKAEDRQQGYGLDALNVLAEYARKHLRMHQLWCNIGADNQASRELFQRAGYSQIGIKRAWQWTPEGFVDECMMQKIL